MKFLLVLLLVGISLAASVPFSSKDVELYSESDDDYLRAVFFDDEGDEVSKNLRERFEEILEKIKDAFENGKTLRANILAKLKEIYDEMREKSIPLGDRAKQILEQVREKATGLWKKILDRISGDNKRSLEDFEYLFAGDEYLFAEDEGEEVAKNLRERFEEILEKIKDAFEKGKTLRANIITKLKEIYDEMREKSIPLGDRAKEILEQVREKATGLWRKILDRISGDSKRSLDDFEYLFAGDEYLFAEDEGEEVAQNLRERFQKILEKIKDAFENRKTLGANILAKLKELYEEMREKSIPMGDRAKEILAQLREKATGLWKRILDRISGESKRSLEDFEYLFAEDEGDEAHELRNRLGEILDQISVAIENGKSVGLNVVFKMKEIYEEMRKKSIPLGDSIKDMLSRLRERATGLWRVIFDRMTGEDYYLLADEGDDVAENLRVRFRELLDKIKDAFEHGKNVAGGVLAKLKEVHEQMREKGIPLGDGIKEFIAKLREKATGLWKRILDRISADQYLLAEDTAELARKLRAHFDEILDKVNAIVENGKALKEDYIQKLKDIRQKLRDMKQDISDHAKELLGKLKEKGKEYWQKILEKLKLGSDIYIAEGTSAEDLRSQLMELLEKLKEAFRNKNVLGGGFVSKLRELRDKFREGKIPLGDKLKELISELKEKASGVWRRILEKFDKSNQYAVNELSLFLADDDIKTELGKRLKQKFDEILEKVRDAVENGKTVKEDTLHKLSELREQLRDMKIDLGEKARNLIDNIKEKAKDYWKQILDKIKE